jgi:hypothetical protein
VFPLRDENPSLTVPVVTRGLIALNAAAFFLEISRGEELRQFLALWSFVPLRLTLALQQGSEVVAAPALTLLTSMFLHGGWVHLIGNMWYLWIFGDNIEDRFGHLRFLLFYLTAGVVAGLLHYFTHVDSRLPTVGASGAIAGVLGAYAAAYPRARVVTLLPLFPFFQIIALPALLVLGVWFVFQFLMGALAGAAGGVAWWAHIGGFAFGFLLTKLLAPAPRAGSEAWVER